MKRKIYTIPKTGHSFKSADDSDLSQSMKVSLSRKHKLDMGDYLAEHWDIHIKHCAFCGKRSKRYNIEAYANESREVTITGVNFETAAPSGDKFYCYGTTENCPAKKLNPNSAAFVAKTNGITEEAAIDLINSRNSSPFYRSNHVDENSYATYQSRTRQWFEDRGIDQDEVIQKANYNRSLEGMIDRLGTEAGTLEFERICKAKANTRENFVHRHGDEEGERRYLKKVKDSACSLENFVRIYGETEGRLAFLKTISGASNKQEFFQFCLDAIKREPTYVCEHFPVMNLLRTYRTVEIGQLAFNLSDDDVVAGCIELDPLVTSQKHIKLGGRYNAYLGYTADGQLLRSGNEMAFYAQITKLHPEWKMEVNGNYPDSNYRYDFYFPEVDTYVEIAGLMNFDYYRDKIDQKKNMFNCLVIKDKRMSDQQTVIDELERRYAQLGR